MMRNLNTPPVKKKNIYMYVYIFFLSFGVSETRWKRSLRAVFLVTGGGKTLKGLRGKTYGIAALREDHT